MAFKDYLSESVFSTYMAAKFGIMLSKPFEEWKAFELGLIDENGNIINKPKTTAEKKALDTFHNLVRKIKKLFNKFVPDKKYLNMLFALYLLKKESSNSLENLLKEELDKKLTNKEEDLLIDILKRNANNA